MVRKTLIALVTGTGMVIAATAGTAAAVKPSGGIWSDNSPKKSSPKPKSSDSKQEKAGTTDPVPGDPAAAANADAEANANVDANANAPAGAKSQGAANANLGAVATANANSALAAGAVASSALPGLTTGLNVKTSAGASLGTVSQVVTGDDGSIRLVIVAGADGKTHRLMPNQLAIAGGVVTTTQADVGG